jgi:hypothetical protein
MSPHWRLALWYAAWVAGGAAVLGAVVWFLYDEAYAGAFLYGAGVGIVSFVSTALTVSLLTRRSVMWRLVGAASFVVRYGFVAVALGVPAYLGLWPVVVMLGGFAGAYLAENVVLLPRVLMVKRNVGRPVRERIERRAEP